MMQKQIGMFIANKVKDEIFKPEPVETEDGETVYVQQHDPLDGEIIRDNSGTVLGRAKRVQAAVYVVVGADGDASTELDRTLNDPDHETIIHWEDNEIGALVFVASDIRAQAQAGPRGFRADDV